MKTVTLRTPKTVEWSPKLDIMTYELAIAMDVLFMMALRSPFPEDAIEKLPYDVRRHFKVYYK